MDSFPYTEEMLTAAVKPYASSLWNWGKSQMGANLIPVNKRELILTLLPRTTGKFSRHGLRVNGLRYHCDGVAERYLIGGTTTVAYNPEDATSVWMLEKGCYIEFTLIESRFRGKDLAQVQEMQTGHRAIVRASEKDNLQAQIHLAQHIEAIAHNVRSSSDVQSFHIRSTRKREQSKHHRDYMSERTDHD